LGRAPPAAEALRPAGLGLVSGVALRPDGKAVAAAGADVYLWDLDDKGGPAKAPAADGPAEARGLAFGPDGRRLAAGYNTGAVRLWDVGAKPEPGPPLRRHTDQVRALAFSPDGRLLASGGWDGRVVLWETAGGRQRREWGVPGEHVTGVAFAADGRHLAFSAGYDVYVVRLAPPGGP
jgi:WD40 repeat protein